MIQHKDTIKGAKIEIFKLKEKSQHEFDIALELLKDDYKRIYDMVSLMWGDKELHNKLTTMLQVDSVGREGFPMHIFLALTTIQDVHMREFGFDVTGFEKIAKKDNW